MYHEPVLNERTSHDPPIRTNERSLSPETNENKKKNTNRTLLHSPHAFSLSIGRRFYETLFATRFDHDWLLEPESLNHARFFPVIAAGIWEFFFFFVAHFRLS